MYLVIETYCPINDIEFIHFIDLNKKQVQKDVDYLFHHLSWFKGQEIKKVYTSRTRLYNW